MFLKLSEAKNALSVITKNGAEFLVSFQLERYACNKAGDKVIKNALIGYFCDDGDFLDLKELESIRWIDLSTETKEIYCLDIQEHAKDYYIDEPIPYKTYMKRNAK